MHLIMQKGKPKTTENITMIIYRRLRAQDRTNLRRPSLLEPCKYMLSVYKIFTGFFGCCPQTTW